MPAETLAIGKLARLVRMSQETAERPQRREWPRDTVWIELLRELDLAM